MDGGLLSNFPIDSLDRTDGKKPRWPSFGVTVLPNLPEGNDKTIPALAPLRLLGPPHLLESVITTVLVGRDQAYLNQPWVSARAIRVDSTDIGFLDFDISDNEVEALYAKGYAAARELPVHLGLAALEPIPLTMARYPLGGGSFGDRAASRSCR